VYGVYDSPRCGASTMCRARSRTTSRCSWRPLPDNRNSISTLADQLRGTQHKVAVHLALDEDDLVDRTPHRRVRAALKQAASRRRRSCRRAALLGQRPIDEPTASRFLRPLDAVLGRSSSSNAPFTSAGETAARAAVRRSAGDGVATAPATSVAILASAVAGGRSRHATSMFGTSDIRGTR